MIDRIESVDPDAITFLIWLAICAVPLVMYWLATRRTKRKPMATPVPDPRCSIRQFRQMHKHG